MLNEHSFHDEQYLTAQEVCAWLRISKSTLYKNVAEKRFPPPVQMSTRCSRWRRSEIHEYLRRRSGGS